MLCSAVKDNNAPTLFCVLVKPESECCGYVRPWSLYVFSWLSAYFEAISSETKTGFVKHVAKVVYISLIH